MARSLRSARRTAHFVRCTGYLVFGTWISVPGTQYQIQAEGLHTKYQVQAEGLRTKYPRPEVSA